MSGRYLISCGGTGGHLAPGISVAERLVARGAQVELLVSHKQVDARLTEAYPHLRFVKVPGAPFGLAPLALARFLLSTLRGFVFADRLVVDRRPSAVVAFGGFLTVPIALACALRGVPLALHEANRRPGRAIRVASRLASRLYLPEGIQLPGVHARLVQNPGYPLRREIRRMARDQARRKLGLPADGKVLVVLGGSQGASALNDWVRHQFEALAADGVSVYCLTGLGDGRGRAGVVERKGADGRRVAVHFVPFSDQMAVVLSAADLVVSRAGAGSIAELSACGVPSVLVPYPHAADLHQHANARFLEQQGGALMLDQSRLGDLLGEVRDLIFNDWMLGRMRDNLERLQGRDAAERIADDLERLAEEHATAPTAGQAATA